MARQLSGAGEHQQRCRQFASTTIGPLHNDISLDGLSLPSLQSSLWSYGPSLSYEQICRSVWHGADRGCPVVNGQSACQHRQQNEMSQSLYQDSDRPSHWQQSDSSPAFVGDATLAFRTVNNCDTRLSSDMSDLLKSSPTNHADYCPSPKTVAGTNSCDFAVSCDGELQLMSAGNGRCMCSCHGPKTAAVHHGTADCCEFGSHYCDTLDTVSLDELRTVKSQAAAAGNVASCSSSEEMLGVPCKLHSVQCASSYLAEQSTEECCDMRDASAARLRHHFYPVHQQCLFTNCGTTGFKLNTVSSRQCQSSVCARQPVSINALDDIDLPLHSASTVNSVSTNAVGISATTGSCASHDIAAKHDSALSHSRRRDQGKHVLDDAGSSCAAAAKMSERSRAELNVENYAEDDASSLLPSKLSASSRKSKKKVERSANDSFPPAPVPPTSVCDNRYNLAAFDGAIEDNLYAKASDHASATTHVSAHADMDCTVAKHRYGKKAVCKENGKLKSESCSTRTCRAAEHPESFSTDSVDTDKLSSVRVSQLHNESRPRLETPSGWRHRRRSLHKASRCTVKQTSTKHRDDEQHPMLRRFWLKQFLESVDWQRQQHNFEVAACELFAVVWNVLKIILGVICYELVLIVESIYQTVTGTYSVVQSWLAEKYQSWKLHRERSNSTSAVPQLSENITLPSTGEEAVRRLFACKGKDPYSILGLRKDCSDEDIRKYYRRQAVLVHPDKNSELGAEEAFKILHHAFEIIGEPEKRRQYDMSTAKELASDAMMQEFTDLLTKLHETIKETINLMACSQCGGKHRRYSVSDVTLSAARYCAKCDARHAVKEGDVWAESSVFGFRWRYYACMDGDVYNITEWASCQQEDFKLVKANSHFVTVHISTGSSSSGKTHHRPTPSEAELEELFSSMFAAAAADGRKSDSFSSPFFSSRDAGSSKTTQPSAAKKKRKKRK